MNKISIIVMMHRLDSNHNQSKLEVWQNNLVTLTSQAGSLLGDMTPRRHLISINPEFCLKKFDLKNMK